MDNLIITIISIVLMIIGAIGLIISYFFKLEKEKQLEILNEWLLYAVIQAEKVLGGGTGEVKLRYVYDLFLEKFKLLSHMITFEQFSKLVDDALALMRIMIANNINIKVYVENIDKEMVINNE